MEYKNGVMQVMQGEQFSRLIGGIDYDACDQIALLLYREPERDEKVYFTKIADELYPNAGLIAKSEDADFGLKIEITEEITSTLLLGDYKMEAKIVIAGVNAPIIKSKEDFFTLIKSET